MTKHSVLLLFTILTILLTQSQCFLHLRSNNTSTQIATILDPSGSVNSTLDDCISKCQQNSSQIQCEKKCKSQNFNAMIFFFSGLGFFLVFFIIIYCCKTCDFQFDRQKKERNNFINRKLTTKGNYDLYINSFRLLLQNTRRGNSVFSFSDGFIGSLPQIIKVLDFKLNDQQDFLTRFTISARDAVGKWFGDGYLLAGHDNIEIWFLKQYENYQGNSRLKHIIWQGKMIQKDLSQQSKKIKTLETQSSPKLSKSNFDTVNSFQGKWFYKDQEFRPQCSGTWKLEQVKDHLIQRQSKK